MFSKLLSIPAKRINANVKRVQNLSFFSGENPDFGKTANDYAKHRKGFPDEFFSRLKKNQIIKREQSVLDIGTGTGTIARGFALEGCYVTAVDPSYALLEKAELLDKNEGVKVNYVVGTAENTGMPNNYFDVVVAGQAWHWFKHEEAIKEVNRVIKYNGKLVIAHFDWLPLKNSIPKLSEELIRKHNPYWRMHGGTGFYPQWTIQLAEACFEGIETYTFDQEVYYTHEDWRGRIRASAGISAALSQDKVDIFDKEHAEKLKQSFPQEVLRVPHRCFTLFATPPKLKLVQDKPEEREVKPNLKL